MNTVLEELMREYSSRRVEVATADRTIRWLANAPSITRELIVRLVFAAIVDDDLWPKLSHAVNLLSRAPTRKAG